MSSSKSFCERNFPERKKNNYSEQEVVFQLEHIAYHKSSSLTRQGETEIFYGTLAEHRKLEVGDALMHHVNK